VRENKWRAARYGLECDAILARGVERPVRDAVAELVERLAPTAAALGCADELAGVAEILTAGNGATRQRHLYAREQSFEAVVDDLVGALG
jgi:glutamate---cysteine ligase / carboxylate-amine ligase